MSTVADQIIHALTAEGVQRLFGMPGGGSIADLIEAAGRVNLPFCLAQTETGAALMACAQAELTGRPGVCLATLGPGAASLTNGLAHAHLDRVPLLAITDGYDEQTSRVMQHQTLDQATLFAPVTRASFRLRPTEAVAQVRHAARLATQRLPGPVHLDCPSDVTDAPASAAPPLETIAHRPSVLLSPEAERLLCQSRRPLVLLGLGSRSPSVAAAVRALCERHGIPALVTYKAKGVVPDTHPCFAGVLTHGALERSALERADLFLALGLDPVELLARPWRYPQPILSLDAWPLDQAHLPLTAACVGALTDLAPQANACLTTSAWQPGEIAALAHTSRAMMRVPGSHTAVAPYRVVEIVAAAFPAARVTVDAGAHMFPTLALWPAHHPNDVLISNGLATMGFALPTAIGAALLDPTRPVVALTGDGGLLMCLGELRTAAREHARLRIIVFDDSALSLIRIKQVQRGYRTDGVDLGQVDWAAVATGLGLAAYRATTETELERALTEMADISGPALVAVKVDAAAYGPTIRALRG